MPKSVPTPVAAALGLVPTVLDSARRLPGKAVQLPVLAVSSALTAIESARREYDELAGRGEKLVSKLRGTSFDEVEDRVEDALQSTPLAKPYDLVEDAVEDTVAKVSDLLDRAAQRKPTAKKAPEVTAHSDLPLPDYDHMTLGSLRGRLRSLSLPELVQVRDYEKAHANRLPVVTLLDNRIAKLATDAAASPSPGAGSDVVTPAAKAKTKVAKAAAAEGTAPAHKKARTT